MQEVLVGSAAPGGSPSAVSPEGDPSPDARGRPRLDGEPDKQLTHVLGLICWDQRDDVYHSYFLGAPLGSAISCERGSAQPKIPGPTSYPTTRDAREC